jgi:hypothetical protein
MFEKSSIIDMIKTSRESEYAFATSNGLRFGKIHFSSLSGFEFSFVNEIYCALKHVR